MGRIYDCYVRMAASALERTVLVHLQSGLDEDEACRSATAEAACALPAILGYTEWVSGQPPSVSVGWDWTLIGSEELCLNKPSIRTNVMLVDSAGRDDGHEATMAAMAELILHLDWQPVVLAAVQGHLLGEPRRVCHPTKSFPNEV
jgi:Domain of unknown function (DUF4902)